MFVGKSCYALALCDPANAVTPAMSVQVSCEEHTSFSEQCGLTSLHTLIWKALFAFYLSPGTLYDWPGFSLLELITQEKGVEEALRLKD